MSIIQSYPGQVLPELWLSGFAITLDADTPDSILNIGAGVCRDSNNVIDMTVGSSNYQDQTVAAPLLLNADASGANGLDTGTIAASSLYAVYIIGDSSYQRPTASLLSLVSNALPLMPSGYDSYRLIGYVRTDSSSDFLPFWVAGSANSRMYIYDAPIATAITAGAETSYTEVDLSALVPWVENTPVLLQYNFAANAAGDTLKLQGFNSTGDAVTVIAQAAAGTAHLEDIVTVFAQPDAASTPAGKPKVNYKVSAGTDAVALNVAGFWMFL